MESTVSLVTSGSIAMQPHIVKRAKQRGLRREVLQFILDYGDVHSGAEALFYYVREKSLPSYLKGSHMADLAKHWVVMVKTGNAVGLTVYARQDMSRHIRAKRRAYRTRSHWSR